MWARNVEDVGAVSWIYGGKDQIILCSFINTDPGTESRGKGTRPKVLRDSREASLRLQVGAPELGIHHLRLCYSSWVLASFEFCLQTSLVGPTVVPTWAFDHHCCLTMYLLVSVQVIHNFTCFIRSPPVCFFLSGCKVKKKTENVEWPLHRLRHVVSRALFCGV